MTVFLILLLRCPCCNLDHLDLVVYLMMRTRCPCPSQCICIFLYITSFRSSTHLSFVLSSFLYAHPLIFPFCLSAFLIKGSTLSLTSSVSFQRDTCCRMLPLCRIAELSYLLNLLATFDYFIPALFITFSHNRRLLSHSFSSFTFVSFTLGLGFSPRNTCTPALDF
jgi:hypothetical protein